MPLSVAIEIAESDDAGAQNTLRQAYEKGTLRGRKFLLLKNLIERRQRKGKDLPKQHQRPPGQSAAAVIRAYQRDANKKRLLIKRAVATRNRLIFVTQALRSLFADGNFVELLRAEGLDTLPRNLASRIQNRGAPVS